MTARAVAVLVDESDERPLELVVLALESLPRHLVVIGSVRRLGFTTDAAIADRHAMRREALVEHLAAMARELSASPVSVRRRSIAVGDVHSTGTLRRARRLARSRGADRLIRRDGDGALIGEQLR